MTRSTLHTSDSGILGSNGDEGAMVAVVKVAVRVTTIDALKNQTVDLIFSAHPTQSVCKSLLHKPGRIRYCLAQLYARDISLDDKRSHMMLCIDKFLKVHATVRAVMTDLEHTDLELRQKKVAPKQKVRIKLRSYWVPLIEDSCKQIMDAARTTSAKTTGPVPLQTKKRIYCVLKSPRVDKDTNLLVLTKTQDFT
ncbi:hypothetical protein L1987_70933 [Smallanthus sonchifolius]|uniref:Uncharacterized protein n=1 Tax=Smallanthus sonchifolius TaxID=185202 RepID=A0ACB9AQ70_9ASTR|nr:hypothetical protein L1987_70933 [Smallanthus sonchifolius]